MNRPNSNRKLFPKTIKALLLLLWSQQSGAFLMQRHHGLYACCHGGGVVMAKGADDDDSVLGRRDCVQSIATLISAANLAMPSLAFAADVPNECQNGALVAESVVPGAYDQICMNLPQRTIPLANIPGQSSTRKELLIQQEGVGAGKTGLAVWNSGLLLGRLLERITLTNSNWWQGQRVAEVGCGAGLVSLLCTHWGAQSVWATDGNPAAVALTQSNFDLNQVPYSTSVGSSSSNVVAEMKWGELEVPLEWMGGANVVLGSDLTYNSGSWRVLAETLETLLAPKGIVIYLSLGHSGFNVRGEMEGFVNVAKQVGLNVVTSSDNLPFALPKGVSSLDTLLQSVVLPSEQSTLAATGGAQVIVMARKR